MRKSRFSESQIIAILKEDEDGAKVADICRRHGISQPTFHRWKAKFGGMDVSEAKRLRELEDENRRLKRLVATRRFLATRRFQGVVAASARLAGGP